MAVGSKMSEGGNEPQEDIISEEPAQPEREHQQVQRNQDTREVHSNRAQSPVRPLPVRRLPNRTQSPVRPTLSTEEYVAWLEASLEEELSKLRPAQRALFESDPASFFRGRIPARPSGPPAPYPSTSEQSSVFDPYSVTEQTELRRGPISPGRGPIPFPPTAPPPPYPYDEEAERIRLARGPNPNGGTPARRFWNRLVRPERRAQPANEDPRLTGQQARGPSDTSDNRDPPPYSRFEPSGQDRRDDNPFLDPEFAQLFRLWPTGQPPESDHPAEAQNVARNDNNGEFNPLFELLPTGQHPDSDHPAEAQNLAGNDNDSEFNQYYQLVSSEQHQLGNQQGATALQELQGDPELPPYTPNEEIGHADLEEDPWDGQDPLDYYMAAIEAGQNPPDGQEPYMPDLGQVHEEWLRMIQRNRRGVNRAAR